MKFHKDGELCPSKWVFVFGSNLAGVHGAGAALAAVRYYGAIYGQGEGLQGSSYGIATKNEHIRTLPLEIVAQNIHTFNEFAKDNPKMKFFVTRVGCGLAGFTDEQIAPMFEPLPNCSFAEEWAPFLTR